ncbi:MAG TPA: hypothetical protein VGE93_06300 [Bryobacteraceae bacterium]
MSRATKDRLFNILKPYSKTPADIYGKEELDALLRKHDDIVRRHLRLWLTSASVLNALISRNVTTRSLALAAELDATLRTYAANGSHNKAMEILEKTHVCVIAGIPGVGKTTLAHVLCAHYLESGYDLIEISRDADDANKVWNDDLAQIFYYDDFLGQSTLEEKLGKNEDSRLLSLMKRISAAPNKRIILTTREYILAHARQKYERMDRYPFNIQTCVVDIESYTYRARASILYNHVYCSTLAPEIKARFASPVIYNPIVQHRNFNPRVIAATLAEASMLSDDPSGTPEAILSNLEEPSRIWEHIVEHQLAEPELALLKLLLTFISDVHIDDLAEIWRELGRAPRDLRRSISTLEGTMVKSSRGGDNIYIGFHNPSVRDYLQGYVRARLEEVEYLIASVKRYEQVEALWISFPAPGKGPMLPIYIRHKKEIEKVASEVFQTSSVRTRKGRSDDYAMRCWIYLEMGADLGSEEMVDIATAELLDGDPVGGSGNEGSIYALLQIIHRPDLEISEWIKAITLESAIEYGLADLGDWNLMDYAEEFLGSLREFETPDDKVLKAEALLEEKREEYAERAFNDWAFSIEPLHPSSGEMRQIVDHYTASPPYGLMFNGFSETVERLVEIEDAGQARERVHSSPVTNDMTVPNRADYRIVESMMGNLRVETHAETNEG